LPAQGYLRLQEAAQGGCDSHVSAILRKLGVSSREDAIQSGDALGDRPTNFAEPRDLPIQALSRSASKAGTKAMGARRFPSTVHRPGT
jgi:hypothetical protein